MAACNPRVVLRNWVAQTAIRAAELGHHSIVGDVLKLLRTPFDSSGDAALTVPPAVAAAAAGGGGGAVTDGTKQQEQNKSEGETEGEGEKGEGNSSCPVAVTLRFDGKPPAWAAKLCVTCSS